MVNSQTNTKNSRVRPLIGITIDFLDDQQYSKKPYYALRENYISSIEQEGTTPIILPYSTANIDRYLDMIDGLIVTGGNFDIDPTLYGVKEVHDTVSTKQNRTEFEFSITKNAFERRMPILGICGGEQLMNVVFGGTLIQDIATEIPGAIPHEQAPHDQARHDIEIIENSLLHQIVGDTKMGVNTSHHQAVKDVAENFIVSAVASDGVIEAIEYQGNQFCLGVQWHPEYLISEKDKKILTYFYEQCCEYQL